MEVPGTLEGSFAVAVAGENSLMIPNADGRFRAGAACVRPALDWKGIDDRGPGIYPAACACQRESLCGEDPGGCVHTKADYQNPGTRTYIAQSMYSRP